ncbi:MAG: NAD-dependent epimerase/dehydratase family protein [Deltaproteobacteria bacterium]|nr:NAD-dependent epimerase/dehydratase family protein [Deltaproteobacteria bacterium]
MGSHLCRVAQGRGWSPVTLVRPESSPIALEGVDVERRGGDLLDPPSVARAMEGIDTVFHVAAVHRNFAADPRDIVRPAVEGTEVVLGAMKAAGVKKLVHTSTAATVGFPRDPSKPYDEAHTLEGPTNPYIQGKVEAERRVLAAHGAGTVQAVVVNPSGIFGAGDYRITPATRAIIGLLQGDPAFLHLCATAVADVAEGHARALERGTPGERYLLTGDNLAPKELAALFSELGGVKPANFRPPLFLLRFLAGRAEKKALRDGCDAPLTRTALADLDGGHLVYDASKSIRELGMTYRPAREVLKQTFRWLLHRDVLAPKTAARVRGALGDDAVPDAHWR